MAGINGQLDSGMKIDGGTDLTSIGNISDSLKVIQAQSFFHPIYTTRVQAVTGNTASATTSLVVNIASSQAGSLILLAVASSVAGTITVTDNLAQSYSTAVSGTSGTHTNYTFYKSNSSAGVTSVTISSTTNSGMEAVVTEYHSVVSPFLDKTSTNTQAGVSAFSSGATATTAVATELLFGSAHGVSKNNQTFTAGTSWTSIGLANGFNAGAGQLYAEDQFVLTTGAYTATGTASGNDTFVTNIATFAVSNNNLTVINSAKVIKSGTGVLVGVVINSPGTGGATATLYDGTSTSGTVIAVISLTTANIPVSLPYNINFTTGLTLVLNSTTADVTVVYV